MRSNLTSIRYQQVLRRIKPRLRRAGLTAEEIDALWYQHDNAPAHTARASQDVLHELFGNNYIGRGGRIFWPPRSPDLNPLDFFLWGFIKEYEYRSEIETLEQLVACIREAVLLITEEMI